MYRLFIICFFTWMSVFSQSIEQKALPRITHYDTKNMGFSAQSWDIKQDENGVVYVANGNNILVFDGQYWKSIGINPENVTRSMYVKKSDSIYFGGDGHHGLLVNSNFSDHAISFLPNSNKEVTADVEEYWRTHFVEDQVVFQTFRNLYVNQGNIITKIPAPYRFKWSYMVNGQVYVNDLRYGIFKLQQTNLIPVISDETINEHIVGLTEVNGVLCVITDTKGIFKITDDATLEAVTIPITEELKKYQIFSFLKLSDNRLALGTVSNGLYLVDLTTGVIENLNKKTGLQNNTILSIYQDDEDNLWLALDYGIDHVKLNSPLHYFYDYFGEIGTTYAVKVEDNAAYLGTNQGLYMMSSTGGNAGVDFELLLNGQVWNIDKVNGELFVGHDKGAFVLDGTSLKRIGEDLGVWNFKPMQLQGGGETSILSGNYNGVSLYTKRNGVWNGYRLKGFEKSGRYLEIDKNNYIWLALRTEGVFRFELDAAHETLQNPTFYPLKDFGGDFLSLSKVGDAIVVTSDFNAFTYSEATSSFEKKALGYEKGIAPTIYVDGDETWYLGNDSAVVETATDTVTLRELKDQLVPDVLSVFPLNELQKIIPVFNGFSVYTKPSSKVQKTNDNAVLIRDFVSVNSDKRYVEHSEIPYKDNNLKVTYALPMYGQEVLYQTKINDGEWSALTSETERMLYNLSEGTYRFYVRASYDGVVKENAFEFLIQPPMYRTTWAYLFYFLLFLILIFVVIAINRYKMKKQEKLLLEQKTQKLLKQEEEYKAQKLEQERKIIELNNSKLQDEIKAKSRELTQIAYVNLNKNKILKKIRDKIVKIQETSSQKLPTNSYNELVRLVEYYITDKESKLFEINFDKSHQEFYEKLSKNYPDLTSKDLRLCAYLKMNLSSKEIAPLLGISSQSVDVSRHRLRKKLNLGSKDNLTNILISLK